MQSEIIKYLKKSHFTSALLKSGKKPAPSIEKICRFAFTVTILGIDDLVIENKGNQNKNQKIDNN